MSLQLQRQPPGTEAITATIVGASGSIAPRITKSAPGTESIQVVLSGTGGLIASANITKTAAPPKPVEAILSGTAGLGIASADIGKVVALKLSDFDTDGLEIDALALITAGDTEWYRDSNWPGDDTYGELTDAGTYGLGLGDNDTVIVRIRRQGNVVIINDRDVSADGTAAALTMSDYLDIDPPDNTDTASWRLFIQTRHGRVSTNDLSGVTGGGYANFDFGSDDIIGDIEAGDRFIIAVARVLHSVETVITGTGGDIASNITKSSPGTESVEVVLNGAGGSIASQITVAPALALSDFDQTGLEVDVLSLILVGDADNIWYRDSSHGGGTRGALDPESDNDIWINGDSTTGTAISRIRLRDNGTRILINEQDLPTAINSQTYFGPDNGTSNWRLYVQTSEGVVWSTQLADTDTRFANFIFTSADADILNAVQDGERVIIAIARRIHSVEAIIAGVSGGPLIAPITKSLPGTESITAVLSGAGGVLTADITKDTPTDKSVTAVISGAPGIPVASADLGLISSLELSSFNTDGLEIDALALITASGNTTWYADSNRSGSDTVDDGELRLNDSGLDDDGNLIGGTQISRIRKVSSTRILINDDNDPESLSLEDYFGDDNETSPWTLYIQTRDGVISSNDLAGTGGGYANFDFASADSDVIDNIRTNSQFIIAIARRVHSVEIVIAGSPSSISSKVTKFLPENKDIEAVWPRAIEAGDTASLSLAVQESAIERRALTASNIDGISAGAIVAGSSSTGYAASGLQLSAAIQDIQDIVAPFIAQITKTTLDNKAVTADIVLESESRIVATIGISEPGTESVQATIVGTNGLLTANITKDVPSNQSIEAVISGTGGVLASTITKQAPINKRVDAVLAGIDGLGIVSADIGKIDALHLSDFNQAGLEIDALALISIEETGSTLFLNHTHWGGIPHGTVLAGDIGLGDADTLIARIHKVNATRLLVNDRDIDIEGDPAPLALDTHFGASGQTSQWRLYIQTREGVVSSNDLAGTGGGYANFDFNAGELDILDNLGVGDRFIIAVARRVHAVEAILQGTGGTLPAANITKTVPGTEFVEAVIIGVGGTLSSSISKAGAGTESITAVLSGTSGVLASRVSKIGVGTENVEAVISGAGGALSVDIAKTTPGTKDVAATWPLQPTAITPEVAEDTTAFTIAARESIAERKYLSTSNIDGVSVGITAIGYSSVAQQTAGLRLSIAPQIKVPFIAKVTKSAIVNKPVEAAVQGTGGTIAANITKVGAGSESVSALIVGGSDASVVSNITKTTIVNKPVNAVLTGASGVLASVELGKIQSLRLSDFNQDNLEIDALGLITADISSNGTWYNDGSHLAFGNARGTVEDGEIGLGDGETLIARVQRVNDTTIRINDRNIPASIELDEHFGPSNGTSQWRLYIQVRSDDDEPLVVSSNDLLSTGGGYANFRFTNDDIAILDRLNTGDRFIIAVARRLHAVETVITGTGGDLDARITKDTPATKAVNAVITGVGGTLSAADIAKTEPGEENIEAVWPQAKVILTDDISSLALATQEIVTEQQPLSDSNIDGLRAGATAILYSDIAQQTANLQLQISETLSQIGASFTAQVVKSSPTNKPVEAIIAGGSNAAIAGAITKVSPGTESVDAIITGAESVLTAAITKADAGTESVEFAAVSISGSIIGRITKDTPANKSVEAVIIGTDGALSTADIAKTVPGVGNIEATWPEFGIEADDILSLSIAVQESVIERQELSPSNIEGISTGVSVTAYDSVDHAATHLQIGIAVSQQFIAPFTVQIAKESPGVKSVDAIIAGASNALIISNITKTAPGTESVAATIIGGSDSSLAGSITKAEVGNKPVNAIFTGIGGVLSSDITKVQSLELSDFDKTGLEIDTLALITAEVTANGTWFSDSNFGAPRGTLEDGEIGMGDGETRIARVRRTNDTTILVNDRDAPQDLDLKDYLGIDTNNGSGTSQWRLYIQVRSDTDEPLIVSSNNVISSGGGYANFRFTNDDISILDRLSTGDRFIIAFARRLHAVETVITGTGGGLDARITISEPGTELIESVWPTVEIADTAVLAIAAQPIIIEELLLDTSNIDGISAGISVIEINETAYAGSGLKINVPVEIAAGRITALITKETPGQKAVTAEIVLGSDVGVDVRITKSAPGTESITAVLSGVGGTLSAEIAKTDVGEKTIEFVSAGVGSTIVSRITKSAPATKAITVDIIGVAGKLVSDIAKTEPGEENIAAIWPRIVGIADTAPITLAAQSIVTKELSLKPSNIDGLSAGVATVIDDIAHSSIGLRAGVEIPVESTASFTARVTVSTPSAKPVEAVIVGGSESSISSAITKTSPGTEIAEAIIIGTGGTLSKADITKSALVPKPVEATIIGVGGAFIPPSIGIAEPGAEDIESVWPLFRVSDSTALSLAAQLIITEELPLESSNIEGISAGVTADIIGNETARSSNLRINIDAEQRVSEFIASVTKVEADLENIIFTTVGVGGTLITDISVSRPGTESIEFVSTGIGGTTIPSVTKVGAGTKSVEAIWPQPSIVEDTTALTLAVQEVITEELELADSNIDGLKAGVAVTVASDIAHSASGLQIGTNAEAAVGEFIVEEIAKVEPLLLSDFDQTGLEIDALALITAEITSDYIWYQDATWDSTDGYGDVVDYGEFGLGLDEGNTLIARIQRPNNGNRIRINDTNDPVSLVLEDYFGGDNETSKWRLYIQTRNGVTSSNRLQNTGERFANFIFDDDDPILNSVADGDRFIIAVARRVHAVEIVITGTGGVLPSARITKSVPGTESIEFVAAGVGGTFAAEIAKTAPGVEDIETTWPPTFKVLDTAVLSIATQEIVTEELELTNSNITGISAGISITVIGDIASNSSGLQFIEQFDESVGKFSAVVTKFLLPPKAVTFESIGVGGTFIPPIITKSAAGTEDIIFVSTGIGGAIVAEITKVEADIESIEAVWPSLPAVEDTASLAVVTQEIITEELLLDVSNIPEIRAGVIAEISEIGTVYSSGLRIGATQPIESASEFIASIEKTTVGEEAVTFIATGGTGVFIAEIAKDTPINKSVEAVFTGAGGSIEIDVATVGVALFPEALFPNVTFPGSLFPGGHEISGDLLFPDRLFTGTQFPPGLFVEGVEEPVDKYIEAVWPPSSVRLADTTASIGLAAQPIIIEELPLTASNIDGLQAGAIVTVVDEIAQDATGLEIGVAEPVEYPVGSFIATIGSSLLRDDVHVPLSPYLVGADGESVQWGWIPPANVAEGETVKYNFRYRAVGTTEWTTSKDTILQSKRIFNLDNTGATEYETQVQAFTTRDYEGTVITSGISEWSASSLPIKWDADGDDGDPTIRIPIDGSGSNDGSGAVDIEINALTGKHKLLRGTTEIQGRVNLPGNSNVDHVVFDRNGKAVFVKNGFVVKPDSIPIDNIPAVKQLAEIFTPTGNYRPVSRKGDMSKGVDAPATASTEGSSDVFVNHIPIHRKGDAWAPHGVPPHGRVLAEGSSTVFANDKEVARVDDPISCGDYVAEGSPNIFCDGDD